MTYMNMDESVDAENKKKGRNACLLCFRSVLGEHIAGGQGIDRKDKNVTVVHFIMLSNRCRPDSKTLRCCLEASKLFFLTLNLPNSTKQILLIK